jgi:hypothetical protein
VIARGRGSLALLALIVGCNGRACDRGTSPPAHAPLGPTVSEGPRCVEERTRGALAVMQGDGPIRAIFGRCGGIGGEARDTIEAWVDRGGTLSRATRSARVQSAWSPAVVVATGVQDVAGMDDRAGPIAWRSAGDDGTTAWWALRSASAERARGVLAWPATVTGRGVLAAVDRTDTAVRVLGSLVEQPRAEGGDAEEDETTEGPSVRTVLASVSVGVQEGSREDASARGRDAGPRVDDRPGLAGVLRGYEPRGRVGALARTDEDGAARVELFTLEGDAPRARGGVTLGTRHVLVAPRGARAGVVSAFVVGGFDPVDPAAGGCLLVGEGVCVRPGPLLLVRLDGDGVVRAGALAPAGLPDALAAAPDGAGWVALFVAFEQGRPAQRMVRTDRAGTARPAEELRGEGIPPLDHPTLVECAGELWLLGEALVAPAEDGAAAETGVTAVPLACLGS